MTGGSECLFTFSSSSVGRGGTRDCICVSVYKDISTPRIRVCAAVCIFCVCMRACVSVYASVSLYLYVRVCTRVSTHKAVNTSSTVSAFDPFGAT